MGLGLSTILYIWRIPLEKAIERIANFGYEGLEIRAGEPDASSRKLSAGDRRNLRTFIKSQNVTLYSLTPDWADINLASPNPMMRQESIREVKEAIELAWDLGAQYFTLPLGRRYSIGAAPIKKAEDWALDSLENCLSFAEKSGVTICLEGYPGQLFGSAEGLLKVARKFHSKSLRIAGDASIAHATGDLSAFFKKIKEYIGLAHISDSEHLPPGLGRIDFREMFDTLKKIGYQGNYLLEIYYPKDPDWAAKHARAFVEGRIVGSEASMIVKPFDVEVVIFKKLKLPQPWWAVRPPGPEHLENDLIDGYYNEDRAFIESIIQRDKSRLVDASEACKNLALTTAAHESSKTRSEVKVDRNI